jgi:hypothetical protein
VPQRCRQIRHADHAVLTFLSAPQCERPQGGPIGGAAVPNCGSLAVLSIFQFVASASLPAYSPPDLFLHELDRLTLPSPSIRPLGLDNTSSQSPTKDPRRCASLAPAHLASLRATGVTPPRKWNRNPPGQTDAHCLHCPVQITAHLPHHSYSYTIISPSFHHSCR